MTNTIALASDVGGVALDNSELVEPRDRLRSALAPKVLSIYDIEMARRIALEIGDEELSTWAENEIGRKKQWDDDSFQS